MVKLVSKWSDRKVDCLIDHLATEGGKGAGSSGAGVTGVNVGECFFVGGLSC